MSERVGMPVNRRPTFSTSKRLAMSFVRLLGVIVDSFSQRRA
jgi:hypothetical protein